MSENPPVDSGEVAPQSAAAVCWRCGLAAPADSCICPHCAARLKASAEPSAVRVADRPTDLNLLFCTYALLLVTGILHAFVLNATFDANAEFGPALRNRLFTQILVAQGIDTIVIFAALFMSRGRWRRELPPHRVRLTAWILSLPLLAALLALNLGYHWLLRRVLHVPLVSDELMQQFDLIAFLAICLQPGIVEEVYCRWFALDSLREATGLHSAVWISATMFGFLHVAVLPGIPYLIVLGAVLGYMRLASGSLLLPIVMHVVHNIVVLLIEAAG